MTCAKRPKGIDDKLARRFPKDDPLAQPFRSHQPRRCKGPGGSSGKSDNGGRAPRIERGDYRLRRQRPGKGLIESGA